MYYMTRFAIACCVAAIGFLGAAAVANTGEGEVVCTAPIGAITVDNLTVPPNASCLLFRTRIRGAIQVQPNAILNANQIMVIGNFQSEGARNVIVGSSRIGGSMLLIGGGGGRIISSTVDGVIRLQNNGVAYVFVNNSVRKDVLVISNTGGLHIFDNRIDGNLFCNFNNPAPIGSGNTVQGTKEGQCRNL